MKQIFHSKKQTLFIVHTRNFKIFLFILISFCRCSVSYGQSWTAIGGAGFSVATATYTSIAIDGSGVPYIAYQDASNSNKAIVKKYNGTSWVTVGSSGFSAGGAFYISIAIDGSGTPYVAYEDSVNNNHASVMKYNGSSWVVVGAVGFSAGPVQYTSIGIDGSGTPYIVYKDGAASGASTVMKYNGSSWVAVGSAAFSPNSAYYTTIAINASGIPYIAFEDGATYKTTVMKYTGTGTTGWVTVGSAGFSSGGTSFPSIALDNIGTPYVAYQDVANSYRATVMKYNGSAWVIVGTAGFSVGEADWTSIAIDGSGTPYVVYQDWSISDKATVMKYNGSGWVSVASAGFSAGGAIMTTIAIDYSGVPYVAYSDGGNSFKATVMTLQAAPIIGTTHLCQGASTSLSDASTGGIWSSSNVIVGTVGTSSGVVTGLSVGTTVISYIVSGTVATTTLTVDALPTTAASNNSPVCVGDTVDLSADATSTSGSISFSWVGPSGYTSSSATPTLNGVTATMAGVYSVVVTTPGVGCVASSITTVTVNPLPTIYTVGGSGTFVGSTNVTLSNSQSGVSYQLYDATSSVGGSVAGTGSSLNFPVTTSGTYFIVATSSMSCTDTMSSSASVTITPSTGFTNLTQIEGVVISPNPVKQILMVVAPNIERVQIMDVVGRVLIDKRFSTGNANINLVDLHPGIYVVKINGQCLQKIVKE